MVSRESTALEAGRVRTQLVRLLTRVEVVMTLALLLLCLILSIIAPRFLTMGNIRNLFWQASFVGIIAIGQTMVILTAGIDLSVGSNAAIAAMFGGIMVQTFGVLPGVLLLLLMGLVFGLLKGILIAYFNLAAFIVSLGFLSIGRSVTYLLNDGRSVTGLPEAYRFFGTAKIGVVPVHVIIWLGLFALGYILLKKTKFGVFVYAIGSNPEAARLSGVRVRFYTMLTYTITGFLCGVAGLILTSRLGAIDTETGRLVELDVIAAVVIGGTSLLGGRGGLLGTLVGVAIITVIKNGLNLLGVSPFWQGSAIGGVIIASVLLDSIVRSKRQ